MSEESKKKEEGERSLVQRLKSTKFLGFAFLVCVATVAAAFKVMPWLDWGYACAAFYATFAGTRAATDRAYASRPQALGVDEMRRVGDDAR